MFSQKNHQKRQANFFISIQVLNQLNDIVPYRQRSKFVEQALARELQQKNFFQALHDCAGAWKKEDHPRSSAQFIRSLRESKRI
ncbi:hypothetical protein HYV57_01920 [Candidatus Peregrinibacteria bacterium]|nr:hypothetical protein [Candidatus Peregrinibacteria bacterium]